MQYWQMILWFFWELYSNYKLLIKDLFRLYRNFLWWTLRKIVISLWSLFLWILASIPVFLIAMIVGFIDPIEWQNIALYVLGGESPSYELLSSFAEHPWGIAFMLFLLFLAFAIFAIVSQISVFLKYKLAYQYMQEKSDPLTSYLIRDKKQLSRFIKLLGYIALYVAIPIFLCFLMLLAGVFAQRSGSIGIGGTEILILVSVFGALASGIYAYYRCSAAIPLMYQAEWDAPDASIKIHSYIKESFRLTRSKKNFLKFFLLVIVVFGILNAPFKIAHNTLENTKEVLEDAIAYTSWATQSIHPDEQAYYDYIMSEFEGISYESLLSQRIGVTRLDFLVSIFAYLLIGALFPFLVTSFYIRILKEEK